MNLYSVLSTLSNPSWIEIPNELQKHKGSLEVAKGEGRQLLDATQEALDKASTLDASNALYAGLLLG